MSRPFKPGQYADQNKTPRRPRVSGSNVLRVVLQHLVITIFQYFNSSGPIPSTCEDFHVGVYEQRYGYPETLAATRGRRWAWITAGGIAFLRSVGMGSEAPEIYPTPGAWQLFDSGQVH